MGIGLFAKRIDATPDLIRGSPQDRLAISEAATHAGWHKSQLERVMGIEPTLSAWEAEVLPLNYTRLMSRLGRF